MRTKQPKPDFSAISRRSVRRDFEMTPTYRSEAKRREIEDLPEINSVRKIVFVGERSSYFQYRRLLLGREVRLVEQAMTGGWLCEFINDDDRLALNKAAGWSDMKHEYLLDCVKFK